MARKPTQTPCPCGSEKAYAQCCQPLHQGVPAQSAQDLMRSRYCAYALGLEDYLLETWHNSTRPVRLGLADAPPAKWIGLTLHEARDTNTDRAIVRFTARYRVGGRAHRLDEESRFVREQGRWWYVAGTQPDDPETQRVGSTGT